jgi:hypothetical protein
LVRLIAGDADLARDDAVPRAVDLPLAEAFFARVPAAGAARDEPLRVAAFFAGALADFFAVFDAAPFARFDLA